MGKKREKKKVIHYIYEGKTEKMFFKHLHYLYPQSEAKPIELYCEKGGNADYQVTNVLKVLYYPKVYLIIDEDFQEKGPIGSENLRKLEKVWQLEDNYLDRKKYRDFISYSKGRSPTIIFSNPSSIEGIILQILGKSKEDLEGIDTDNLKSQLSSHISQYFLEKNVTPSHDNEEKLREFFAAKISKELLDDKRKTIKELDYILGIFE